MQNLNDDTGTGTVPTTHLDQTMAGTYLVTTKRTKHVWNLDHMTYQRRPGPTSKSFDHDGTPHRIVRVEMWPSVGRSFLVYFEDPDDPGLVEQWRMSSPVRSITRIG